MTTPEDPTGPSDDRERRAAELRAELEQLEGTPYAAPTVPTAASASRTGWWRPVVATVLIVVMAILAPLAVVARWAHDEVNDTDRFVSTVAPLAEDPAVQRAVADRITTEIVSRLRVEDVTQEAIDALSQRGLPPVAAGSLQALSGPLANAIEEFVARQVTTLVESDAFATAWEQANREAHTQLVAVLTGKGSDVVDVSNGVVSVNLATVIDAVKAQLVERGFTLAERLPDIQAQFTVFESADIQKAQTAFRVLSAVNTWLPIIALICLAGAVLVGRSRRRTLIAGMLALAASMLLLGVALNIFRTIYLDAVPQDQLPTDAAGAIYDQLANFIRLNLRAVAILALAVAFIAWVSGDGRTAVAVRRGTSRAVDATRSGGMRLGLDTGGFGVALDTYRNVIRGVVLGGGLLVYLMRDHPTGGFTLVLLAVVAVILLLVELLARPASPEPPPTASSASGPP